MLQVPEIFSFIDDPDAAIETMRRFVRFARDGAWRVAVHQEDCKQIDLCAASVINALALDAKLRLRTTYSGRWPQSDEAMEIVAATGLPSVLNIVGPIPEFDSFGLRYGGDDRRSLIYTTGKEVVSSDLAKYIRRWFAAHDFAFSTAGMERIGRLVGETLANAEEHSGLGSWWAAGYLRQPRGAKVGDVHLTFFNFGHTISDSLKKTLEPDSPLRTAIEELVQLHGRKHFFDRSTWTEEELWTLYALQDRVSCKFDEDQTRGFGIADIIEEFGGLGQTLAGELPTMSVVSGHAYILFQTGRYSIRREPMEGGGERRIIAFNEENDLQQRPNSRWARRLQQFFPGTMISLRFFMDRDFLQAVDSAPNHADRHDPTR